MDIKGATNVGLKRKTNQDYFFAEKVGDVYLSVVCDGMGGANGGNIASENSVKIFVSTFEELLGISSDYKIILLAAVTKANDDIYTLSRTDPDLKGMGTTMVACVLHEDRYYIVNVGDSRLYFIDKNKLTLRQVTKDHSLVQEMLESGKLTPKEAEDYPKKNIITRAIGIDETVVADISEGTYNGELILLCSDGLYNFITKEDIVKIVTSYEDINVCIDELVRTANENGGGDNITAVVMRPTN